MEFDDWGAFFLGALVMWGIVMFRKVLNYDPFPDPPSMAGNWKPWQPPVPPNGVEPLDRLKKGG